MMTVTHPALAPPLISCRPTPDGGRILSCDVPLEPYEASVGLLLRRWAGEVPDRIFLAERDGDGGWAMLSFGEASRRADAVAQALLDRGLGAERPVMLLSGNSVDHALLTLGGLVAGVPVVPVSPAYSLMSEDFGKVRHIAGLVRPGLVYAADGGAFEGVLGAVDFGGAELVVSVGGGDATRFARLLETVPTGAVEEALGEVGPDDVAKVLFTSGSTGLPKGVLNTHRMLCSNQQSLAQIWPFTERTPPVLVDWLPWHHTFGGNHNFNLVLRRGGTLYIDAGRPAPRLIETTVRNLTEIAPTIYFNVPAGYAQLLPHLERDGDLRASFFSRLQLIFYAAAALPQELWERLETVSARARGEPVMMTSSWGLTETAPLATSAHFAVAQAGVIGVPVPGVEIKMTPVEDKEELRVRGPNVTPGYLGRPDLSEAAFDEEGFYRTGDAGRLEDPDDPAKGLVFDGRLTEDFKLTTGTWVSAGHVRVAALDATAPLMQDAVVCGHDREYVALLAWPNVAAVRDLLGDPDAEPRTLVHAPQLVEHLRARLAAHNRTHSGSSMRIARVLLLAEPPSLDANEVTDKGYVNQRATRERRGLQVNALYAEPPPPDVIVCT
jgi:feruloyl-CoA synthase